jgi:hypothetical protein
VTPDPAASQPDFRSTVTGMSSTVPFFCFFSGLPHPSPDAAPNAKDRLPAEELTMDGRIEEIYERR